MATTNFQPSRTLIDAVKGFEGLRLRAYHDSAGVPTIGYGHTLGVKMGTVITEAQAGQYLTQDLWTAARPINALGVCKTQGQFDALVDFVYNLGYGRLKTSTLLRKIQAGAKTAEIQAEFRRWVYAGKTKLPGLVKRREWEAQRWAQ